MTGCASCGREQARQVMAAVFACTDEDAPRPFALYNDIKGQTVALGVQFADGVTTLRRVDQPGADVWVNTYRALADVLSCLPGTRVVWLAAEFTPLAQAEQEAMDVERERIAQLADRHGAVCTEFTGFGESLARIPFSQLLRRQLCAASADSAGPGTAGASGGGCSGGAVSMMQPARTEKGRRSRSAVHWARSSAPGHALTSLCGVALSRRPEPKGTVATCGRCKRAVASFRLAPVALARTATGRRAKHHASAATLATATEALRVLAENTRALRLARGYSYAQAEQAFGVSSSTIWKLEHLGGTDYRTVAVLAAGFGVPVADLVTPAWRRR